MTFAAIRKKGTQTGEDPRQYREGHEKQGGCGCGDHAKHWGTERGGPRGHTKQGGADGEDLRPYRDQRQRGHAKQGDREGEDPRQHKKCRQKPYETGGGIDREKTHDNTLTESGGRDNAKQGDRERIRVNIESGR